MAALKSILICMEEGDRDVIQVNPELSHLNNTPTTTCTCCGEFVDMGRETVQNRLNNTLYCHNCIRDYRAHLGEIEDASFYLDQVLAMFFEQDPNRQGIDIAKLEKLRKRMCGAIDDVVKFAKQMEGLK